jgi:carboxyl-terminal processing protease
MEISRRGILISAAVSLLKAPALADELLSEQSASTAVEQVRHLVEEQFYDAARAHEFYDAIGQRLAAGGKESDVDLIRYGLKALQASHTDLYTQEDLDFYEIADIFRPLLAKRDESGLKTIFPPDSTPSYEGAGIVAEPSNQGWYVAGLYDAGTARHSGLVVGDLIVSADDQPFHPIRSFIGKAGQTVELILRRVASAPTIRIPVQVERIRPNALADASIRQSVAIHKVDGAEIGYIRLWTNATPESQKALQTLLQADPLNKVSALVVDLRCRHGGSPPNAADIFVGASPQVDLIGRKESIIGNFRYRKPVVGIIDGGTRSGLEIFAYTLRKAGVMLVGTRTAGALLGGTVFLIGDGSLLYLAVMDSRVDGERLEGFGVQPTIQVAWNKLFSEGHDPQLQEAIRQASILAQRERG